MYSVCLERLYERRPFGWVHLAQIKERSDVFFTDFVTHWVTTGYA